MILEVHKKEKRKKFARDVSTKKIGRKKVRKSIDLNYQEN